MGGKRLDSTPLLHVSTEREFHGEIRLIFWKRIWTRIDERNAESNITELCTCVRDVRKLSDYFVLQLPGCLRFEHFNWHGPHAPRYCFAILGDSVRCVVVFLLALSEIERVWRKWPMCMLLYPRLDSVHGLRLFIKPKIFPPRGITPETTARRQSFLISYFNMASVTNPTRS